MASLLSEVFCSSVKQNFLTYATYSYIFPTSTTKCRVSHSLVGTLPDSGVQHLKGEVLCGSEYSHQTNFSFCALYIFKNPIQIKKKRKKKKQNLISLLKRQAQGFIINCGKCFSFCNHSKYLFAIYLIEVFSGSDIFGSTKTNAKKYMLPQRI